MSATVHWLSYTGIVGGCVVVATVSNGTDAGASAVVGALIVAGFFALTPPVLRRIMKTGSLASLLGALIYFVIKIIVLLALFVLLSIATVPLVTLDQRSLGVTMVIGAIAWTVLLVIGERSSRQIVLDLDVTDNR